MNLRTASILLLAAGQPLAAQELFLVHYSWSEVLAGTDTPVANPNGVLGPGEGARIRIGVTALVNGGNAIGQPTTYPPPIPPGGNGTGTIKGLGSVVYDLIGDNGAATADGSWSQRSAPGAPFTHGLSSGTVQPGGNRINGFGGAQFLVPGQTASSTNSNVQVFIGTWTPDSYALRNINFRAQASIFVPPNQQNSLLVAYGTGTDFDPNFNVFTHDLYLSKFIGTNFGAGVTLPIPSPSSLAVLGLAALVNGRRGDLNTSAPPAHPRTPSRGPAPSETQARSAP